MVDKPITVVFTSTKCLTISGTGKLQPVLHFLASQNDCFAVNLIYVALQHALEDLDRETASMDLSINWGKTKVQNLSPGAPTLGILVRGQAVESVEDFNYLGSIITADGRCGPDMARRMSLASSAMNDLRRVWRNGRLKLHSKLRIYMTCVVPVLLYGSETWVLLKSDMSRLEAFHMRCQRRILGIR
jgi:hypothetical protein